MSIYHFKFIVRRDAPSRGLYTAECEGVEAVAGSEREALFQCMQFKAERERQKLKAINIHLEEVAEFKRQVGEPD